MRLLIGNPNTTAAVTERIGAAARAVASAGTEVVAVTAGFGAAVIATRTEMAIAEHASLDLLARHAAGFDAVIVGASLDSGVRAARQMLPVPVVGITEAALHTACLLGGRFGVVTLSSASAAVTREMVAGYGLEGRMAGLRWVESAAEAVLDEPARAVAGLVAVARVLVERDGAEAIVLVGAVMAGLVPGVQAGVGVPVLEGVSCAVVLAEGLVRLGVPKAEFGSFGRLPGRAVSGVGDEIKGWFGG